MAGLKTAKNIVIKPNCDSESIKLASTHVDALEAVLQFIRPLTKGEITVAEGTSDGRTMTAFKNFGYFSLQDRYGFAVCDLNTDDTASFVLQNDDGGTWEAKIAKTILETDCLISVSPPKTHDGVLYTGAANNIAVGALTRKDYVLLSNPLARQFSKMLGLNKNYKSILNKNAEKISANIIKLYKNIPTKLAVIDGFESMEGNGPIEGELVPSHFAIASSDPIAADWLASQLMGIDPKRIEYLSPLLDDNSRSYFVVGDDWQNNIRKFRLPSKF